MYCCTRRHTFNIPIPKFKDGTTDLDLSNEKLNNSDLKKIVSLMAKNTSLTRLILSQTIENTGAHILGEGLSNNKGLNILKINGDIPFNEFRDIRKEVDTSDQNYKDVDTIVIAGLLQSNSSITVLNLALNQIQDNGAQALAKVLEQNGTLTNLNLSNNHITDVGASSLGKSLKSNRGLKIFNLGDNQIRDEGTNVIASSLAVNTTLTQLLLYMNMISDVGAQSLANALERNTSLMKLQLNQNTITCVGAKALAAVMQKSQTFNQIHLSQNKGISYSGRKSLRDVKKNNSRKIIKI